MFQTAGFCGFFPAVSEIFLLVLSNGGMIHNNYEPSFNHLLTIIPFPPFRSIQHQQGFSTDFRSCQLRARSPVASVQQLSNFPDRWGVSSSLLVQVSYWFDLLLVKYGEM